MGIFKFSYMDIAGSWELWNEYVNPGAVMSYQEWEELDIKDRISLMIECFGEETEDGDN